MLRALLNIFKKKKIDLDSILKYSDGKRIYRDLHTIRKNHVDEDALKIIYRLSKFGYKSYLVGGGVRDLLIGRRPKDFDIATTATPNQIKKIFNNCRIIGKRFKIVHVIFRGKIIEVSTFRSLPDHRLKKTSKVKDYLITKDNIFGNAKEDAARRDFTINALYFDPRNESIIDYVGGFEDLENKYLRVIGDPDISFKEDPVRMLRAVKFCVLLDMTIEPATQKAIKKNKFELEKASSARLLEEYNKIFRTGKTSLFFYGMAQNQLLDVLFSSAFEPLKKDKNWPENFYDTSVGKKLVLADKLHSEREELTPTIYYSLLFSELVDQALKNPDTPMNNAVKHALDPVFNELQLPKKEKEKITKVFLSQRRFVEIDSEDKPQIEFFKKKDYFYDAFMYFKIKAISENREQDIQSAFFWEISSANTPRPQRNRNFKSQGRSQHNNHHGPKRKNRPHPIESERQKTEG